MAQMRACTATCRTANGASDPSAPLRPSEQPEATAISPSFITGCAHLHWSPGGWNTKKSSALQYPDTFPRAAAPDGSCALPNRR